MIDLPYQRHMGDGFVIDVKKKYIKREITLIMNGIYAINVRDKKKRNLYILSRLW